MENNLSIVIPARNEAKSLRVLLPALKEHFPSAEIIVSNDGSSDDTLEVSSDNGALVVSRPHGGGNGSAIKAGARRATREYILFMDADGQHRPEDIPKLLSLFAQGYDMVVGARSISGQAGWHRGLANAIYNRLASWMVGAPIRDLTSGFRLVRRDRFLEFLYLLPNGFSYPTTITMAFFRAGYSVAYTQVKVLDRHLGTNSHIRVWRDGLRFLLIIFKIGTLYSPLKIFVPISMVHFVLGLIYYCYTYLTLGRLSLATIFMFISGVSIFMIGLVSEQITSLLYKDTSSR